MYQKVYVLRRERKLKQKDVAKKMGIHPQSYHLKESGKRDFTIKEGLKLAKIYKLTLNDLFEKDEYTCEPEDNDRSEVVKELTHHLEEIVKLLKSSY